MRFEITSKLFGRFDIDVATEDMESDMWEDMGKFLCVNIFQEPDDEDALVPFEKSRWVGNIYTLKTNWYVGKEVTSYGDCIEDSDGIKIEVKQ